MRFYIFDFKQEIALERNLSLEQLLILDYLIKFFESGNSLIKNINNKKFGWITYDKVISDLPILKLSERGWQRCIKDLEEKNIIERVVTENKSFIHINNHPLHHTKSEEEPNELTNDDISLLESLKTQNVDNFTKGVDNSNKIVDNLNSQRQNCTPSHENHGDYVATRRQNCHPIVNYYNNKIKILVDDERVKNMDSCKFLYLIKSKLKENLSPIAYDICIKNMGIPHVTEKLIVLSTSTTNILKYNSHGAFEKAVSEALELTLA